MNKKFLTILILVFSIISFSQSEKPDLKYKDGKELIAVMYTKYAPAKWYRYFTFSQGMEYYRNDSMIRKETWHEAYQPGTLLIKFETKNSKSGRLYSNFTQHAFKEGHEPHASSRIHELLLVGLDVYFFKPEQTIRILDSLGYDLSKMRTDEFAGRKVYVVGAEKGDEKSRQFWFDAERLYMHRIVYEQKGKTNDVVFSDYKKMDGNWIAPTIIFKTDGKLYLIEHYYDIKFPKSLNQDYFKPEKFNEVVLE
jgi:hypothetical protein